MSLYFNYKVDVFPSNAIHVNASLHSHHKILAVASHSEEKGGTVTLCNDEVCRNQYFLYIINIF